MKYTSKTTVTSENEIIIVPIIQGERPPVFVPDSAIQLSGEVGEQIFTVVTSGDKKHRVWYVGLGTEKKITAHSYVSAVAGAVRAVQEKKQSQVGVVVDAAALKRANPRTLGELLTRAIGITTYHFTDYLTDPTRHATTVEQVTFFGISARDKKMFDAGIASGAAIDASVQLARNLGNHFPGHMHPLQLGRAAQEAARGLAKLSVRVLSKKEITKEKMGGLLGVSAGSVRPPAFIIMEYRGGARRVAPTVLVGKGITFDTGGISIKPSDKMDEMKFDMMGGATVIATVCAAARLKLKKNIIGLVPAAENMPSGSATVPGDILKMHNGATVEVLNTDAEGRLILADALSYAKKYNPSAVIDLATLTGACIVALGELRAGLWSTDEKLCRAIQDAAERTNEMVWRMPLGDDFTAQIKSEVADYKNISDRMGSANGAAAFLQAFAPTTVWAHIDIAGVAWSPKLQPARRAGASGWGVALLIDLLRR